MRQGIPAKTTAMTRVSGSRMDVFKMTPDKNRIDCCEWLLDGSHGSFPVRQKAHDPKTGEVRIFEVTEWAYYIEAEIKVFPEQDLEVWKTVSQGVMPR
jgi:hypothetical protein